MGSKGTRAVAASFFSAAGAGAAFGCAMVTPESGELVADVSQPVAASGLVPTPNTPVRLEIYDRFASKWTTWATATSESAPLLTDKNGASHFPWRVEAPLPGGDMFWKMASFSPSSGGHLKSRVRATIGSGSVTLSTLDDGAFEGCVVPEFQKTQSGMQAMEKCKRAVSEVELRTPCGGLGQLCCTLAPTCWQTTPEVWAPKCMKFDAETSVSRCEVDKLPPVVQKNYPEGEEFGENPQGVAHSSAHWFFTTKEFLWKVPVSADLGAGGTPAGASKPFAGFYKHLGDPAFAAGKIYVPLEQGVGGLKNAIGIVDATSLKAFSFVQLPELTEAPWCEVFDGVLYVSGDHVGPAEAVVRRYRLISGGLGLEPLPPLTLRNHIYEKAIFLGHIQGGAISPVSRTLYLSTAATSSEGLAAVWGFDLATGAFRGVVSIKTYGTDPFIIPEVEGLDYWDDPPSPGIGGQLHVIIAQIQDASPSHSDDYTFAHLSVASQADAGRL